jgi:hypothetical protein
MVGWVVNDELERTWKKQSWPNMRYYIRIWLEGMRKTMKTFVGLQTDIWTQGNINMKQECNPQLNSKIHYHVHKSSHLDPIQSQFNSVPTHDFSRIHIDIITPKSLIWPLPLRFPHQNFIHIGYSYHACYKSHRAHLQHDQQMIQTSIWIIYLQN